MSIKRITSLFAANVDSVAQTQARNQSKYAEAAKASVTPGPNQEAVSVNLNPSVQQRSAEAADTAHREHFNRIKEAVLSKTYKSDSREVALAIARDIV